MDGGSVLKEYLLGYDKSKMATPTRKLKPVPLDIWSVRERLALACSVLRSGDQNWVSVSRAIKPFGEASRPPDWFSQKNCALQYSDLLENVETPKRKRGERGEIETPGNQIARNLTFDRIEELKKLVLEEQQRYKKLKREVELIKSGQQDDKLKEVWEDIQSQQKTVEEAAAAAKQKAAEDATPVQAQTPPAAAAKPASKVIGGAAVKTVKKPQPKQLHLVIKESSVSDQDDSTLDSIPDPVSVEVCEDSSASPAVPTSTPSAPPAVLPSPQPEEAKSTTPQTPLLSHLLKTKTKLPELTSQQSQSMETEESTKEKPPPTTKPPSPQPPPRPPTTTVTTITQPSVPKIEIKTPAVEIKQEPPEVEEKKTEEKQPTPLPTPAPVTKTTTTETPVSVVTTVTTVSKTEIPSSPSLGAPTLSKLLCNPVAAPLSHKLDTVKQTTPPPEPPTATKTATPKEPPPKSPVVTVSAPEPAKKTESTDKPEAQKESSPPPASKPATPTKQSANQSTNQEQDTQETVAPVPPSPTVTKTSLSSSIIVDEDISFKEEPASPASSVVSNVSETAPKVVKAKRGRPPKNRRSTRITPKSVVEKDETGSKQSEQETSDDETIQESDDGMSSSMTAKLNFSLPSESVPNSPASMSQSSDTEDEKAYKVWKKSIMLVWRAAANHKYANVFLHPVTNDIAPGYTSVVFRPMDLLAIKKNVENGIIRTTAEFQRDVMLMFTNAIMYNSSDHNVHRMAVEMYNDVMMHIEQYVNTQMMVQTEPKMLRPSRRSDAPSDKEEEAKRRRTSTDQHNMESGGKSKKRKTRSDDN